MIKKNSHVAKNNLQPMIGSQAESGWVNQLASMGVIAPKGWDSSQQKKNLCYFIKAFFSFQKEL